MLSDDAPFCHIDISPSKCPEVAQGIAGRSQLDEALSNQHYLVIMATSAGSHLARPSARGDTIDSVSNEDVKSNNILHACISDMFLPPSPIKKYQTASFPVRLPSWHDILRRLHAGLVERPSSGAAWRKYYHGDISKPGCVRKAIANIVATEIIVARRYAHRRWRKPGSRKASSEKAISKSQKPVKRSPSSSRCQELYYRR